MTMYEKIHGIISGLSHIFYLPGKSKCFFIEIVPPKCHKKDTNISEVTDRRVIVAWLEGLDRSFQLFHNLSTEPPVGKCFEFTNLHKGTLKIGTQGEKISVLQTTKTSKASMKPSHDTALSVKELKSSSSAENLISYEGIVTNDNWASSGIYTLDQRLTLVQTGVCLVSNVRVFRRGHRVHLVNAHFQKLDGKPVMFLCGRSYAWSTKDDFERVESIHNKSSRTVFESSPLIKAALHHNLSVSQILELRDILESLRAKFVEDFLPRLAENFKSSANFENFIKVFELEKLLHCNQDRSLISEYFARPHSCSLSKGRSVSSLGSAKKILTIRELRKILENHHQTQLSNKISRYSKPLQFDFCVDVSENFLREDQNVVAKVDFNERVGAVELSDTTGSIQVCILGNDASLNCEKFLGCYVTLKKFRSCAEVFQSGARLWRAGYIICSVDDFEIFLEAEKSLSESMQEDNFQFKKSWKLLYASGPLICSSVGPTVICGTRPTETPMSTSQISFVSLPVTSLPSLKPGVIIRAKGNQPFTSKYSPQLSFHRKKNLPEQSSSQLEVVTREHHLSFSSLNELASSLDFTLEEFETIPENEMVNVVASISERWLEEQKTSVGISESLFDSILTEFSLQIKLRDPRFDLSSGTTISLYITHWSHHPYPIGLLPGNRVRFNNVIKVVSKKGHAYLTSSLFSTYHLISCEEEQSEQDAISKNEESATTLLSTGETDFIIDLVKTLNDDKKSVGFGIYVFSVTLESFLKISISAACPSCGTIYNSGRCTFVGCHDQTNLAPKIVTRCVALVEDETSAAIVHLQEPSMVQTVLQLSESEWKYLVDISKESGEVLYLPSKNSTENLQPTSRNLFRIYVESLSQSVYSKFVIRCRPFKKSNLEMLTSNRSDENFIPKLFCLDVIKC